MNLQELFDRLDRAGRIKPTRLRDVRSAINRYAQMLGRGTPGECPEPVYAIPRDRRNQLIEEHLKDASRHVLRNVKNNVSFVIRGGEELGLIRPVRDGGEEVAPRQFGRRKIGRRFPALAPAEIVGYNREPYALPLGEWPKNLKAQYDEWRRWVTEAQVPRHYLNPRNRPATIDNKTRKFEAFFGYLANVRDISKLDFEMLIDVEPRHSAPAEGSKFREFRSRPDKGLLEEFVQWHRDRRAGRASAQAREVVSAAGSVARRYYFLKAVLADEYEDAGRFDALAEEISRLRASLDEEPPSPIIPKESRKVGRDKLLEAARAEFPRPAQHSSAGSGTELASKAGRALAIMMLLHHPFRNRYYREARLGRELVSKEGGGWYLRVRDGEGARKGVDAPKKESPDQPISPQVVNYLEEYLKLWRPKLVRKLEEKIDQLRAVAEGGQSKQLKDLEECKDNLFLHTRGGPFTRAGFGQWIQTGTYRWLGVRVNPETIRSISFKSRRIDRAIE